MQHAIFLVGKVLSSVSVQGQRVEANYLVFLVSKVHMK